MRTATAADIVTRLTGTGYDKTAVTALGWGMGPAQNGIEQAVADAEAAGLVIVTTGRGKDFVHLAQATPTARTIRTLTSGPYTLTLREIPPTPGGFTHDVTVWGRATEDDALSYDMPQGAPILADEMGAYDLDQAHRDFNRLADQYATLAEAISV